MKLTKVFKLKKYFAVTSPSSFVILLSSLIIALCHGRCPIIAHSHGRGLVGEIFPAESPPPPVPRLAKLTTMIWFCLAFSTLTILVRQLPLIHVMFHSLMT